MFLVHLRGAKQRGRFTLVVSVALSLQPVFEARLRPPLTAFLPDLARTFLTVRTKARTRAVTQKQGDYDISVLIWQASGESFHGSHCSFGGGDFFLNFA